MTSKSKLWSFVFVLISGVMILFPAVVHALTFQYGKPITIDHMKVPATLTNFPVLVSIPNDNDLKNHVTSANGYDLIFTDAVGNPLDHELESWDGATGTLVAWVRIPSLSSTADTVIYVLYGNTGVTTSQENKTGVWDANFKGVWHLPNGITLNTAASNSGGNSFTVNGVAATGGQVDGAANFVRSSSTYLSQASDSNNNISGDITVSLWLRPTYTLGSGEGCVLIHKDRQYSIFIFYNGISWADGTNWSYGSFGYYNIGIQNNVWQHLVVTKSGTTVTIYLNGVQQVQESFGSSGVTSSTNDLVLGVYYNEGGNGSFSYYYGGYEDEVRLSNVARSADWILTEYNNQSSASTFYTIGSETQTLDTTAPVVTAFVIPSVYNLTVPITTFTATDNVGVTGYLVNESPSTPSVSDPNWSTTPQTQYIFSSYGNKTLYAWAKDAAGNVSTSLSATVVVSLVDVTPPTVTAFTIPANLNSRTVPITTFTATDNVGVTGYLINESPSIPSLSDPNWSATPQTQYIFSSYGNKTLYAWAKDAAGNVSTSLSATVSVDPTPPTITAFTIPANSNSRTVPITAFTATDNVGVTGYLVNESPSTPSVSDPNWGATPQTQYAFSSDGSKTLYAWAKDAAGNISTSLSATVSVAAGRIYVYDELNRLIQIRYEDGRTVTYTYDASGNRITLTNE